MSCPVTGTLHTGFQVSDLGASLRFYCDLLGLEVVARRVITEEYIGRLLGYEGLELHSAYVRIPGSDHLLELLDYRGVPRQAVDPASANPGTAHICLTVEDLAGLYDRLRAAGVRFAAPPVVPTSGANAGRLAVYMLDPDGIRIELLQLEQVEGAIV